jgi:alpha-beta hydrolase superfamily lysophospholipase
VLILLVGVAGTGLIFQVVATRNDQQEFPAPGELVDIGGYQLHINCIGNGSPTIILDASGGSSSASWGLVQPEIVQSTRVCAYDLAGAGWSDRGPIPRDMNQQVRELHALLARARIDGPHVLVGHSYGGRIPRGQHNERRDHRAVPDQVPSLGITNDQLMISTRNTNSTIWWRAAKALKPLADAIPTSVFFIAITAKEGKARPIHRAHTTFTHKGHGDGRTQRVEWIIEQHPFADLGNGGGLRLPYRVYRSAASRGSTPGSARKPSSTTADSTAALNP